jgi:glycosyltransferase involved in cell wall biosynthesis
VNKIQRLAEQPEPTADGTAPGSATSTPLSIILVGTFPPTRCGIASFTWDLRASLTADPSAPICEVIAVKGTSEPGADETDSTFVVRRDERRDYAAAADFVRRRRPDILCIQHEFGIFGGDAGGDMLELVAKATCPVVTVLHTVLERPNPDEERVFNQLVRGSDALIVMSEPAREILLRRWAVDPQAVFLIPHGVPEPHSPRTKADPLVESWRDLEVLLSFGFLSPDKGVESVIRAMPAIVAKRPHAQYVVAGVTHPNIIAREGERHRVELSELAQSLGVSDRVRFVDDYLSTEQLAACIEAADICLMPYRNADQVTSGTLSYAVGLGRPVIATPFLHALAMLADGGGVIVPFEDPDAISRAALGLLDERTTATPSQPEHPSASRPAAWGRLAPAYLAAFAAANVAASARRHAADAGSPSLEGIRRMTDHCGLLQHSLFDVPNRQHGYCLDDNARALLLMNRLPDAPDEERIRLTRTYAAFLEHAWRPDLGCFRNFMSYERTWLEDRGSDDSCGRAFWAACVTAVDGPTRGLRRWGRTLVDRASSHLNEIVWPRSDAFILLGLCALQTGGLQSRTTERLLQEKSARLASSLDARRGSGWDWFEDSLSYDNSRLSEALIRVGMAVGDEALQEAGLRSLRWLCQIHGASDGTFRPVGTQSFGLQRQTPSVFDQQPLEAAAMIDACAAALSSDGDPNWIGQARMALRWFEGANDLGVALTDAGVGECFDGISASGLNPNQGAESVLARQFAICAMREIEERAWHSVRRDATI